MFIPLIVSVTILKEVIENVTYQTSNWFTPSASEGSTISACVSQMVPDDIVSTSSL